MEHKLILSVPENVYEPLAKSAERTGQTPEKLAVEWLATAAQYVSDDPLEEFIGAFRSNIPDWADQHDKYIGQALLDEMRNKEDKGKSA